MDTRIRYSVGHYGGVSMHRAIRLILLAVAFLSGSAHAFKVPAGWNQSIVKPVQQAGGNTAYSAVGTGTTIASDGKIASNIAYQYQGKEAIFGSQWALDSLGATGNVMTMLRAGSMLGLGLTAVSWLGGYGLQYVNGRLEKQGASVPPGQTGQCATKTIASCNISGGFSPTSSIYYAASCGIYGGSSCCAVNISNGTNSASAGCGFPQPATASGPATEADLTAISASPMPTTVAQEFARAGTPMPVAQTPVGITPANQILPVGEPYVDPVTGKRVRDGISVSPSPSSVAQADAVPVKVEVDVNGNPINTAPVQEQTDLCKQNPDAAACKPLDEVPDENLQTKTINLSVVPLPGFGPDSASCPAPQNLFSAGGQQITWSWSKFCDFSLGIRPLVLGFAWIAAIMIVVGVARREA